MFKFKWILLAGTLFVGFHSLYDGKAYGSQANQVVIVQSGDTLSSIAAKYNHNQDVRKTVDQIMKENHLESTFLQVGDELYLPAF